MNLNCPYCGEALDPVLTDLMSDWAGELLFVCLNDDCSFMKESWKTMKMQGAPIGYRYFYLITNGSEGALLVKDKDTYKDRVVDLTTIIIGNPKEKREECIKRKNYIASLRNIEKEIHKLIEKLQ